MAPSDQTRPALAELRAVLSERGLSDGEVDRRTGFPEGRARELLEGPGRITLEQLLEILDAADLEPADFFARLAVRYREGEGPMSEEEVRALYQRIMPTVEKVVRDLAGEPPDEGA